MLFMRNLTLRRADMLKLNDMTARPFDSMLMRGQSPWNDRRDTERRWGEFTTEDAYRVAVTFALVRLGWSYEDAGRTVRSNFAELVNVKSDAPGDLLFGTFITESLPAEEAGVRLHLALVATETEWFSEMARMKEVVAADDQLLAFSTVNATAVMRRTLGKADAADLRDDRLVKLAKKVRAL